MFLFALNQAGTVTQQDKMKCLACKMWAPDGTPWRDYIPVIKDGVYCMYDKVTQTYNFGFGTFTGA
jgi:hypothetical protein